MWARLEVAILTIGWRYFGPLAKWEIPNTRENDIQLPSFDVLECEKTTQDNRMKAARCV
jgi:hypothetical protein